MISLQEQFDENDLFRKTFKQRCVYSHLFNYTHIFNEKYLCHETYFFIYKTIFSGIKTDLDINSYPMVELRVTHT